MNYIRHLTAFFDKVSKEEKLNPTHISLYMSLFQFWNINRFINPISISRSEMMGISKICSKATYHKVMKDLHQLGFIKYEPSYNPFRGSSVTILNFDAGEIQKLNGRHTKKQTSGEPAVGRYRTKKQEGTELLNEPYINSINIVNNKHSKRQAHEDTSSDFDRIRAKAEGQEKKHVSQLARQNENEGGSFSEGGKSSTPGLPAEASAQAGGGRKKIKSLSVPVSPEEVQDYFAERNSTRLEAEKFFNYFQSNGWKVGGRAAMQDWKAAARNWILNSHKFETKPKNGSLHVNTNKNYGEPL
ncbi:MAG: hypothetical protein OJF59_000652 [Cytophagales bacterium]|jgi:phage FluMu protein gp41|nr:transcriptional regulator [Bacteroidota bacterium]MBS1558921.1 transcriptional regulator [Bacteroidota bacterium]MBS1981345.1 transcriptional regulator [Bacteroidota bacterium]WHZ06899.1 MAG: hypothetical protein OJF59_000652 [Cytophagales bacterium]